MKNIIIVNTIHENSENKKLVNRSYKVFTDGACSGNGTASAKAGYAVIVCDGTFNKLESIKGKVEGKQTNNRAELFAVLTSLEWIENNIDNIDDVVIYADSEITVKGLTGECARNANRDIWDKVEAICENITAKAKVSIVHTAAHTKDNNVISVLNNETDKLAKIASRALLI